MRFAVKFPWIKLKDYNGPIVRLQGREDVESWILPLFNAGFFKWRWRVNLILRWPGERRDLQGIFSLDGRRSNTALSTKTLKEMIGKEQLVRSKLAKELNSFCVTLSLSLRSLYVCVPVYVFLIAAGLFIEVSGVNVPPKNAPQWGANLAMWAATGPITRAVITETRVSSPRGPSVLVLSLRV